MTINELHNTLETLLKLPAETEIVEFKKSREWF